MSFRDAIDAAWGDAGEWVPARTREEREERWRRYLEAAPRMAAALTEAGYPATYEPWVHSPGSPGGVVRHVVSFRDVVPPERVIRKAAEVCGVPDLFPPAEVQPLTVDSPHWAPG